MNCVVDVTPSFPVTRTPWNKGKMIGAKPPLRPKHVWPIGPSFRSTDGFATWRCSTWPSTVSCVVNPQKRVITSLGRTS